MEGILHVFKPFLNHVHAFSLQCRFKNEQNRGDDNEVIEKSALPIGVFLKRLCLTWIPSLALCRG